MTLFQSGWRAGGSSTVSSAFPLTGSFCGSATVIRPWSMSASNVRYDMRGEVATRSSSDKVRLLFGEPAFHRVQTARWNGRSVKPVRAEEVTE